MLETFKLTNWVVAREGCQISYNTLSGADVDFSLGDQAASFDLCLDRSALREFVRLGSQALQEMESLLAAEEEEDKKAAKAKNDADGDEQQSA